MSKNLKKIIIFSIIGWVGIGYYMLQPLKVKTTKDGFRISTPWAWQSEDDAKNLAVKYCAERSKNISFFEEYLNMSSKHGTTRWYDFKC